MERQRGKRKVPQTATSLAIDQALGQQGSARDAALGDMNAAISSLMAKHGAREFHLDAEPRPGRSVKVSGSAMTTIGIWDGDTVLVDDQLTGKGGDLVLVTLDGKRFEVRRLRVAGGKTFLHAENPDLSDEDITNASSMTIHGVVTKFDPHA